MTTQQQQPAADPTDGWHDQKAETLAPTLEYDDLTRGMIVRYKGVRKFTARDNKSYAVHQFVSRAGTGQPFELWGAAQLNGKLRPLKAPVIVYLRYDGKQPSPEQPDQEVHTFTVRTPPSGTNVTQALGQMATAADALDRSIRLALERDRERRQANRAGGEPEPPPHTDSDLPF